MSDQIGVLDRLRELLHVNGGESGTIIAKSTTTGAGSVGMADPNNSRLLADEGYRKNVVIYACINIVARTASEPDLIVGQRNADGEIVPIDKVSGSGDSPGRHLQALLEHPNREQSQYDWLERALIEFGYSGNSITHKMRPKAGRSGPRGPVAELWQLTPYRTKMHLGEDNLPGSYEFPTDNPGRATRIPAEDIIHIKKHDPANEHWGLSALLVAARVGDLDNMGTEYLRTMFHNLGEPSALLIFNEIKTRLQHQRTREMWKETHGGTEGWHNIGTLDASVKYQAVGSRPDEMELEGVFSHSETRICSAFGVPPILVATATGLARSTYANYKEALRDFWTDTVVPMYVRVGDKLTHGLANEFAEDLVIFFDTTQVGALQEDRKELREFAMKAWDSSLLPRNRVLELSQVDAIDDAGRGDAYKVEEQTTPQPVALEAFAHDTFTGHPFDMRHKPLPVYTVDEQRDHLISIGMPMEALKLPPKIWRDIDRAADRAAPWLAASFSRAVANAQRDVSLTALVVALENNDTPSAEVIALKAWDGQQGDLRADFKPTMKRMYIQGGEVGDRQIDRAVTKLERKPDERLLIDGLSADEWVEAHLATFIANISAGSSAAIRAAVLQLGEGISHLEVARIIRAQIGLTPSMVAFVENQRIEKSLSAVLVQRLSDKLVRRRAVNIAVSEGRRAASEGQEFVWRKAKQDGILKGGARQYWITAGDGDVCHICSPMDGQEREIGETFISGTGGEVRLPPDPHVGCRCARGIRLKRAFVSDVDKKPKKVVVVSP